MSRHTEIYVALLYFCPFLEHFSTFLTQNFHFQIKIEFQQCERTAGCTEFILAKEKDCFLFFTDQEKIPDSEATDIQTLTKRNCSAMFFSMH